MEYKVGDKVRIKDLEYLEQHKDDAPRITPEMLNFAGCTVTIGDTYDGTSYGTAYKLVTDCLLVDLLNWRAEWFEPADPPIGSKVRIKSKEQMQEICKTLDKDKPTTRFVLPMERLENSICTLSKRRANDRYEVEENRWVWHRDLFEVIETPTEKQEDKMTQVTSWDEVPDLALVMFKDGDDGIFIKEQNKIVYVARNQLYKLTNSLNTADRYTFPSFGISKIYKKNQHPNELIYDASQPRAREMTIAEISKKLGYDVKVVKERDKNG